MVGKGLEREYLLLRELLLAHDCYVVGMHYTDYANATMVRGDITMFLEVVMPPALHLSRENWLFPNSEWWDPRNDRFLPHFTRILCKTQDCYRIWCQKVDPRIVQFIGFEARDMYNPMISREPKFLHVAGESEFKNTEAVIEAWQRMKHIPQAPQLTVVTIQQKYIDMCQDVPNLTCIKRATEPELKDLLNSHLFHLIPSAYEGFGHILNEGLGCGALVITTDAPPMNEFTGVIRELGIMPHQQSRRSLATLQHVHSNNILPRISDAMTLGTMPAEVKKRQEQARESFLKSRDEFRQKILALIGV